MKELFDTISFKTSRLTTKAYSTSFSLGINLFHQKFRYPIYAVYGFVRAADEIVDSFHKFDKKKLLSRFSEDTFEAIDEGISLNPLLNSFQQIVNKYKIDHELIDLFLNSMEMDLQKDSYSENDYGKYILGSAEVVGLMCLRIFTEGNESLYQTLKPHAMKLGSAYQKINFLRDIHQDYFALGRTYFPGLEISKLDEKSKKDIEQDIEKDFKSGYEGIKLLPKGAKLGVYVSYVYYYSLFRKIKRSPTETILSKRVRITNFKKYMLLLNSAVRYKLNIL